MATRATITPFDRSKQASTVPPCPSPPHHWVINDKNFGTCKHGCKYQFPYSDQDSFTERNSNMYLPSGSVQLPYN